LFHGIVTVTRAVDRANICAVQQTYP
jgi:hypothetical protein